MLVYNLHSSRSINDPGVACALCLDLFYYCGRIVLMLCGGKIFILHVEKRQMSEAAVLVLFLLCLNSGADVVFLRNSITGRSFRLTLELLKYTGQMPVPYVTYSGSQVI